jgi:CBS domain-containing protein
MTYSFSKILSATAFAGLDVMLRDPLFSGFFCMEPSESKPNTKEVVEGKPVKEITERAVSLETTASVKSAVDHLETHGLEAAPVTDPEGTLVGKISKDRMIRGVSGRGHDPQTTPLEPEVEKEGEPYCYEHEPIAKAEEVMRQVKADAVSVVSEEKKLIGKATRDAIDEERLKAESGKPRTDLKEPQQKKGEV